MSLRLASPASAALSGLAAADTALAVSANNLANVLSKDFTPSRAEAATADGGGVKVSISAAAAQGAVGSDFATELVAQSRAVAAYRANLKTVEASDAMDEAALGMRP